jgi:hypothetical protein
MRLMDDIKRFIDKVLSGTNPKMDETIWAECWRLGATSENSAALGRTKHNHRNLSSNWRGRGDYRCRGSGDAGVLLAPARSRVVWPSRLKVQASQALSSAPRMHRADTYASKSISACSTARAQSRLDKYKGVIITTIWGDQHEDHDHGRPPQILCQMTSKTRWIVWDGGSEQLADSCLARTKKLAQKIAGVLCRN